MTMKKITGGVFFSGALCCMLLLCGGCSFFKQESVPTCYYDLGIPGNTLSSPRGDIIVQPFGSLSGERYRMMWRKGHLLYGDDENKWQMPPGSLVTKYLTLAFRTSNKSSRTEKPNVFLDGRVTAFEADGDCAVLGLLYRVSAPMENGARGRITWLRDRSILLREKLPSRTPEAFAAAMTKAMEKATKIILQDIDGQ